jgi:tripartite-type tricarboxylate transporter receptor subunit TctC
MVRTGTPNNVLDTLMSAVDKMKTTTQWREFSTLNMQSSMNISLDEMQARVRAEVASNREFLTAAGLRK